MDRCDVTNERTSWHTGLAFSFDSAWWDFTVLSFLMADTSFVYLLFSKALASILHVDGWSLFFFLGWQAGWVVLFNSMRRDDGRKKEG